MKTNHVLINYENMQPALADALSQPVVKVWVFLSVQQAKVKVDLLDLLQRKGSDARVIKMTSSGRNALDFHMACYLGELATMDAGAYLVPPEQRQNPRRCWRSGRLPMVRVAGLRPNGPRFLANCTEVADGSKGPRERRRAGPFPDLISKKPQPTEEQAHVVSHPTASM
jgi:hypothetical protein